LFIRFWLFCDVEVDASTAAAAATAAAAVAAACDDDDDDDDDAAAAAAAAVGEKLDVYGSWCSPELRMDQASSRLDPTRDGMKRSRSGTNSELDRNDDVPLVGVPGARRDGDDAVASNGAVKGW
jgi:hypothetical protein